MLTTRQLERKTESGGAEKIIKHTSTHSNRKQNGFQIKIQCGIETTATPAKIHIQKIK